MESTRDIERKLKRISDEVEQIRKQVIRQKTERSKKNKNQLAAIKRWEKLGKRITARWKGPTAVEEIRLQREKVW